MAHIGVFCVGDDVEGNTLNINDNIKDNISKNLVKKQNTKVVLTGIGHFFPQTVLDNKFFEELEIDTTEAWIEERIGIKERRSVLSRDDIVRLRRGETNFLELKKQGRIMSIVDMSKPAWAMALERASAGRQNAAEAVKVDLVCNGTSIPDNDVSPNSCYVADALGLECAAFDVNSACSTFALHLHMMKSFMETGFSKKSASFIAERFTTRQNYADRSNSILFGDSGIAAIIEAVPEDSREKISGLQILDTSFMSAPSGAKQITMEYGGTFTQNGAPVQKYAITTTVSSTKEILERNGLSAKDVRYFISHQANLRMLSSVITRLGLTEEQHLFNIDYHGNQGASGAPAVMSQNWEKFKQGDVIVVTVVGAGLSWGSILFKKI